MSAGTDKPFCIDTGRLLGDGVVYRESPNADRRPATGAGDIHLLVIHNISLPPGEFGTGQVERLFTNRLDCSTHPYFERLAGVRVSAHLFIDRHGVVTQFVNFNDRAWHAGVSHFDGRDKCNDFSIGIELEGTDDIPYTEVQYCRLAEVCHCLQCAYPAIAMEHIVGHSAIASGRKTDPGASFDWHKFHRVLTSLRVP